DLKAALGVADLAAFGGFSRSELAAIAGLLKYVELTQVGRRAIVRPPIRCGAQDAMVIDAATRANLELVRATGGGRRNTLLEAMDRTVTGPGARELAARIAAPLTRAEDITARLDAVGFLIDARIMREEVRTALRSVPDVARALSRLQLQRGSPRDLGAVRDTLAACATIVQAMEKKAPTALLSGGELPAKLAEFRRTLSAPAPELADALRAALVDQLPSHARDGGYIRAGYHAELDATRRLRDESRAVLAELQATYQSTTAVKALKIKHNNVLGYFVEVTAAHGETLRSETLAETFRHRQTLANAVRFTTDELEDIEQRLTQAGERALAMEAEIYAELSAAALAAHPVLNGVADSLAALDCLQGLAMLADEEGHTRPIVDDSLSFHLQGARHPVVERALRREDGAPFVANDCMLGPSMGDVSSSVAPSDAATEEKKAQPTSPQAPALDPPPGTIAPQEAGPHGGFDDGTQARVWIVTGPNMAGKSTFLRQNALIAVMAQMGAYVPADRAHIGIVDRLFSRVGASDDLARGRSTFMVEMVETAGILNLAGERSLVILDEIGRGTATFDGLSIAWATVEYLQSVNRCRALFATHYHELTALADRLPNIANVTMSVKEWRDDIVFLHKVVRGAASRSYGIQVARLAGLPGPVITRAGEVLRLLEEHERGKPAEALIEDLPLFAAARPANPIAASPDDNDTPLSTALDAINPDMLSPREALDALYRLKDIGGRE
ncbi:MAG: DNA mismatch repair protein MutS, partial [Pseudomonadota bacterium]